MRGDTIANFPGLLQLRYAGCVIFYVVAPGFLKVYLLNIEKEDAGSAPPTKEEAGLLRKLLVLLGKGAVIAGVKKGVKWLWEYWRDGSPPSL